MSRGKGMGGHQRGYEGKSNEWLTPRHILQALGEFDLDPCAPVVRPWNTAKHHFTVEDDGLAQEWFGRVWLNPPYGQHGRAWLQRLRQHGTGTALIFARTETASFFENVWQGSTALLFLDTRLTFCDVAGVPGKTNGGAPSVLVAYGLKDATKLANCGLHGAYIPTSGVRVC